MYLNDCVRSGKARLSLQFWQSVIQRGSNEVGLFQVYVQPGNLVERSLRNSMLKNLNLECIRLRVKTTSQRGEVAQRCGT